MWKLAWGVAMGATMICATPAAAAVSGETATDSPWGSALAQSSASVTGADGDAQTEPSLESGPGDTGWEVSVTPYLWASGVSGDVELAEGEEVNIDTKFTDILSDLKFAFMGAVEARNQRLILLGDIMYISLGTKSEGPLGFVEAKVDTKTFVGTALVGYRVVDKGATFVDVLVGGRYSSISADVVLTGPLQTRERDKSNSVIAPVVAARFRTPLGGRWGLGLYGDIGGFGVTADLSWQILGTVQYEISDHWRALAGYRYFHIRQDKRDFEADIALHGPIIGISYRF